MRGRQRTSVERAPLRPRWGAWLLATLPGLAVPLFVLTCALYYRRWDWLPLTCFTCFVSTIVFALRVWWEYQTRPPVFQFWEDRSPFLLTVRDVRSGKVLLKSSIPTLAGQDLSTIPLQGADLRGVDLERVDFTNHDLSGADLRGARLNGAQLSGANLRGANMEGARLDGADLSGADLRHARLATAGFLATDFRAADLRGADFVGRGATRVLWDGELGGAQFVGACYDSTTRWPVGFNRLDRGCVRGPELATRLPIPAEAAAGDTAMLPVPAQSGENPEPASIVQAQGS